LSLPLIKGIVEEVESGMSRKEAVVKYGMAQGTLDTWMVKFGNEELRAQNQRRYSASQKRSAVRALESGMTSAQAAIACGIKDSSLVRQWKTNFDRENVDISTTNPPVMPQKKSAENDSEEVRALKKALAESQMQNKALNTLIDVAQEMLKIDIRKKPGARQSSK
jgi:transposase